MNFEPLDLEAVGKLIGVKGTTVSSYLQRSKPGGIYADHPFPDPSDHLGRSPWWHPDRAPEIKAWADNRVGQGAGGGRKAQEPVRKRR